MHRCCHFFKLWVAALEHEPGMWLIRDTHNDIVWRSAEVRAIYDDNDEYQPWKKRVVFIDARDASRVADLHSLCLKTGRGQVFYYHGRLHDHRITLMLGKIIRRRCSRCPRHCSLIIGTISFVDDEGLPTSQAPSWRQPPSP